MTTSTADAPQQTKKPLPPKQAKALEAARAALALRRLEAPPTEAEIAATRKVLEREVTRLEARIAAIRGILNGVSH